MSLTNEKKIGRYVSVVMNRMGEIRVDLKEKLDELEGILEPYSADEPIKEKGDEDTGIGFETDMDKALQDLDEEIARSISHVNRLISEFRG